ncbi:hypothetical protein [Streptomyces sp. NPDC018693]|uniref:hypothetical protein n=1 Tax=unclassified Streptomyces TaxID=2593676 RepID=UPI00378C7572
MYEYEMHQHRSAELIRRAEQDRLVREVLRAGDDDHKTEGRGAPAHRVRRYRFARAA